MVIGLLVLSISACNDYKKITYQASDFYVTACDNLSDTLAITYKQPRSLSFFNDSTWTDSTISQNAGAILDSLELYPNSSVVTTPLDSLIGFFTAPTDTGYISLHVAPNDWVFFLNDYVQFHLFSEQGDLIAPIDQTIKPEEVLACDTLKVKQEYTLTDSRYLFQLIHTNKSLHDTVNLWMAPKQ